MTRQEGIFEIAKTFFAFDKKACYMQLKKINFDELVLGFGKNSELESDIRNLMVYIAVTEDMFDLKDINLVEEFQRILNSPDTKMFYNNLLLASYLIDIASKKLLVNINIFSQSNLIPGATFTPDINMSFRYTKNISEPELIKDDIVKLIELNSANMLTKERLEAYDPLFSETIPLLKLKISFAVKKSLFDYGLKSCNELLENKGNDEFSEIRTFIDYFINNRGLGDEKLNNLVNKFRLIVQKTADEMRLDKTIFMYEYATALSGATKIDLIKKLKLLIDKYAALGIETTSLLELNNLKGL